MPERPCVPMTRTSGCTCSTALEITSNGAPSSTTRTGCAKIIEPVRLQERGQLSGSPDPLIGHVAVDGVLAEPGVEHLPLAEWQEGMDEREPVATGQPQGHAGPDGVHGRSDRSTGARAVR